MRHRNWLLSTCSAIALSAGLPGVAHSSDPYAMPAGMPAVSAANGKVGAFVGSLSNSTAVGAVGSWAFPLSDRWGGQIDGLLGTAGGGTFYGVGGHLFVRDPARGLIGGYASYVGWGTASTVPGEDEGVFDLTGANVGKVGVEGEAYFNRISLEGLAALQFGTHTGLAGKVTVAFYPTDDLRLDLSYRHLQGAGGSIGAAAEWQLTGTQMSLFADGSVGGSNNWSAIGGLKIYFAGEQKSLIRRHREDDPDNLLPNDLYTTFGEERCPDPDETLMDDGVCIGSG